MAQFSRLDVLNTMIGTGLLPLLSRENFIATDDFDGITSLVRNVLNWICKTQSEM